jgi:hypothetical protein
MLPVAQTTDLLFFELLLNDADILSTPVVQPAKKPYTPHEKVLNLNIDPCAHKIF